MLKRFLTGASIIALSMGMSACEKIEQPGGERTLLYEDMIALDSIPLAYGKLVAITSNRAHLAELWFEKPDKTVVLVRVNYAQGFMSGRVLTIPRK